MTADNIRTKPRKSAVSKAVPSHSTERITADIGSTLAKMLPLKGPIMLTPCR